MLFLPYECGGCEQAFSFSIHLEKHKRNRSKKYNCEACKIEFCSNRALVQHRNKMHLIKNFSALEASIGVKNSLVGPKRNSVDEKHYECNTCDASFNKKSKLAQHEIYQSCEKHHKCMACDASFSYRTHLERHKKHHTNEISHECKECSKSFNRLWAFTRHIRSHKEEKYLKKPYKCRICEKICTSKNCFNKHERASTLSNDLLSAKISIDEDSYRQEKNKSGFNFAKADLISFNNNKKNSLK